MKKTKIFSAAILMVLCVGVLAIGVFALAPTTNNITGTIGIGALNDPVQIELIKDGELIKKYDTVRGGVTWDLGNLKFNTEGVWNIADVPDIVLTLRITNIGNEPLGAFFAKGTTAIVDGQSADADDIIVDDIIYKTGSQTDKIANVKLDTYTPILAKETMDMTITLSAVEQYSTDVSGSLKYNMFIEKYIEGFTEDGSLLKIPTDITEISTSAYASNATVKYVAIPSNITNIQESAFSSFTALKEVNIPKNITAINDRVFNGTTNLKNITLRGNLTHIGDYAFSGGLVEFPFEKCTNLESIGTSSFRGTNLKYVNLSNCTKLASIGTYAFGSTKITTFDVLGCTELTTIYNTIIYDCVGLKTIKLHNNITLTEAVYAVNSIEEVVYQKSVSNYTFINGHMEYAEGTTNITVPSELQHLIISVYIPTSATSIADSAFSYSSLKHLDLSHCTSLRVMGGRYSFNCKSLISVKLPNNVKVGYCSFQACPSLKEVIYETSGTGYTFKNGVLKITADAGDSITSSWTNFSSLIFTVDFSNNTSITSLSSQLFKSCNNLTNVINLNKCSGVTELPSEIFYGCSGLTSIELPTSITYIGIYAFCQSGLEAIDLSALTQLNSLGNSCFYNCANLSSIKMPSSCKTWGTDCFFGCDINDIEWQTSGTGFNYDNGTLKITAEAGTTVTKQWAGIEDIIFAVDFSENTSVTEISANAFQKCFNLKSVNLSVLTNLQTISASAFSQCTALTEIYIPATVTTIAGEQAFLGYSSPFNGCSSDLIINCEILEENKPEGWAQYWNYSYTNFTTIIYTVNWGVSA